MEIAGGGRPMLLGMLRRLVAPPSLSQAVASWGQLQSCSHSQMVRGAWTQQSVVQFVCLWHPRAG